jgi:hypothetical protein
MRVPRTRKPCSGRGISAQLQYFHAPMKNPRRHRLVNHVDNCNPVSDS